MSDVEFKINRIRKTLKDRIEPDRIPIHDFFWEEFLDRWTKEMGLPSDTNIYKYYDMDMMVISANWEPKISQVKLIEKTDDYIMYEDGFGAVIKKYKHAPMQQYLNFKYKDIESLKKFEYDNPLDDKRYSSSLNIVSKGKAIEIPSFNEQVKSFKNKFCIFASVCEGYEAIWRIHSPESSLMNMVLNQEDFKKEVERIGEFMKIIGVKQLQTPGVNGVVIWGDIAYKNGMLFSPNLWRKIFKPVLKNMILSFKEYNVPIIYHGCGNSKEILEDLIEVGIDAYHTLEVKAGMDVVELKRKYKNKLAYLGNIDALNVLPGSKDNIKKDLLYRLNAAKGGGFMPGADHSVPGNVSAENYDYFISLIKDYGRYPLNLGECDIDMD